MKKIFLLFLFFIPSILLAQPQRDPNPYFPMEIGNRWDYLIDCHGPGGIEWTDTLSVKIIGRQTLTNGKEYYVFSNPYPYPYFLSSPRYIRNEANKIYFYDEDDSIDCFTFRFDLPPDSFYYNCKRAEIFIYSIYTSYTFGIPDTWQEQSFYTFSKKFGPFRFSVGSLVEYDYQLYGCIISGVTYGNLLVSFENNNNKITSFKLEQNFPNPFNPTTTIKYSIANKQLTTLKIYDVLCKEVASLIDEEKRPGEYEVKFDGSKLASGIYFYRLQAGNFVQVKKMLLLK